MENKKWSLFPDYQYCSKTEIKVFPKIIFYAVSSAVCVSANVWENTGPVTWLTRYHQVNTAPSTRRTSIMWFLRHADNRWMQVFGWMVNSPIYKDWLTKDSQFTKRAGCRLCVKSLDINNMAEKVILSRSCPVTSPDLFTVQIQHLTPIDTYFSMKIVIFYVNTII